ncbi:iron response transcriptional regulator IrrA [Methylocapsa palsarum]|nr:Fur family transcriptional regulator [Methylocapsa palsarum]
MTSTPVPSKRSSKARRAANGRVRPLLGSLAGCPFHDLRGKLSAAGLRPTRQRMSLGWHLFAGGDRHLTAERLYEEMRASQVSISLATVYNSLHQFTESGLLREIAIDGSRTYFDTNVTEHHHFLVEGENELIDIPQVAVDLLRLPPAPAGKRITQVDVVVRVRDIAPEPTED